MRFTFEREEIVSVLHYRLSSDLVKSLVVKLSISEKSKFLLSKAGYFSAELKTTNGAILGDFVFSSIDDDFFNIESVGEVTFVAGGDVNNDNALRIIAKIQKQLDKLKVEFGED